MIPHCARRIGPVQVRRFVEIPGQQNQVGPFSGDLFEERRNGLVARRLTVHAQDGLRIAVRGRQFPPRHAVVSSRQVAGVMRIIQMGRIEQDIVPVDVEAHFHIDTARNG